MGLETTAIAGDGNPASTGKAQEPSGRRSLIRGLLRTARPRQWIKNVLVFAAPGAAGVLLELETLAVTLLTFLVFSLAASGTYFLNDLLDREADRRHPTKRHRPIATGLISLRLAAFVSAVLPLVAVGAALAVGGLDLAGVVGAYVVLTVSYSVWLKHIAVVDLVAVGAGFVLRAVGGGIGAEVPLSDWFLIVTSSASLFMIAGKRAAEHSNLGASRSHTRVTLEVYSLSFLRYVRSTMSAVAIGAYCMWAFEKSAGGSLHWFELSIAPFVMGILRYALLLEADEGEAPEDLVLGDRPLQVIGLLWAVLFAAGVHGT